MALKEILIIEDDDDIRETLRELLMFEGYTVSQARHGQQGLDILKKNEIPGLIFLDLMMPVMNGWEFLDEIRKETGSPFFSIPIVIISAAVDAVQTRQLRTEAVLKKPLEIEAVIKLANLYCRTEQDLQ